MIGHVPFQRPIPTHRILRVTVPAKKIVIVPRPLEPVRRRRAAQETNVVGERELECLRTAPIRVDHLVAFTLQGVGIDKHHPQFRADPIHTAIEHHVIVGRPRGIDLPGIPAYEFQTVLRLGITDVHPPPGLPAGVVPHPVDPPLAQHTKPGARFLPWRLPLEQGPRMLLHPPHAPPYPARILLCVPPERKKKVIDQQLTLRPDIDRMVATAG